MILDIGPNCKIDISKYQEDGLRIFITGQSGSGKSYLAKVIVEELADLKLPIVIIDPEGEYGAFSDNYSTIIVGGGYADLSLDSFNMEIAEKILNYLYSPDFQMIIFDTSEKFTSEQSKIHSVILEAVFNQATVKKNPTVLVTEEAHIIAPQTGGSSRSLDLAIDIAKRGRKRGLHSIWVTQRPADVNKQVISQCNIRFFGRHQEPADINALKIYTKNLNIDERELMSLNKEFFLYTRGETRRIEARALRTRDLGSTPSKLRLISGKPALHIDEVHDKPDFISLDVLKFKANAMEVKELSSDEISLQVLKNQLKIRDSLKKLGEAKRKYLEVLDEIIADLDAGNKSSGQAEMEVEEVRSEILKLNRIEVNLYSDYRRLPYEVYLDRRGVLTSRLKRSEELYGEGKISEEGYLLLKKEYLGQLEELDKGERRFKEFIKTQISNLKDLIQSVRQELELLTAKYEVGEFSKTVFENKEKELKNKLEDAAFCIQRLNEF